MLTLFWKTIVMYALLLALMRLVGKRQLGDLELSELIVTILISEMAAVPLTEPDTPLWYGVIPLVTLLLLEFVLSLLTVKNVKLRALLCGKPALLVVRGRIDQSQMRRNRFTPDELMESLRNEGVLDLREVEYAILETDGRLNVILAPGSRPLTAAQMNLEPEDTGYPLILIDNGRILTNNLLLLNKDRAWLKKQLAKHGVAGPEDVYMMTCDMADGVFIAQKEDV